VVGVREGGVQTPPKKKWDQGCVRERKPTCANQLG